MRRRYTMLFSTSILVLVLATCVGLAEPGPSEEESACAALTDFRNRTIISADVREVGERGALLRFHCLHPPSHLKPPWRERKEKYIAHLREAGPSVWLVAAADVAQRPQRLELLGGQWGFL